LLTPNYILTAAHCVDTAISTIEVVLGAHNIRDETEATQVRLVATEYGHHELWSRLTMRNDIAWIKLPQAVELNENIQLTKIPTRSQAENTFVDEPALASGWGKDSDEAAGISEVLRSVEIPIITNEACDVAYGGVIYDSHICANGTNGRSTCNGDSGGPLVLTSDSTQIGLTSFGISLGCEIGWPAAFTRVSSFLDWLATNTDVQIQD